MTAGKAGLLTAGFVAVFAFGVMSGPTIRENWPKRNAPEATAAARADEPDARTPGRTERAAPRARSSSSRAPEAVATKKSSPTAPTLAVSVWQPELRDRAKAVLNPGARLDIAAEDFHSSEQFMTVAHAARNTTVPFMVLKDRVLNRGQSLAEAIHELKPELDAKTEVQRARAAARSDLEIAG